MGRLIAGLTQWLRRRRDGGQAKVVAPAPAQTVRPTKAGRPPAATAADQPPRVPQQRATVVTRPPARGRHLVYAPELDGRADPGEIVWTWVPYEEDPNRGKDRPVLVVGRDGKTLLGLMLSSNADRDGQRHWHALGPGPWDRQGRPSWVRLDRVLLVPEDGIRREGCILDPQRFEAIAAVLRRSYAWS